MPIIALGLSHKRMPLALREFECGGPKLCPYLNK